MVSKPDDRSYIDKMARMFDQCLTDTMQNSACRQAFIMRVPADLMPLDTAAFSYGAAEAVAAAMGWTDGTDAITTWRNDPLCAQAAHVVAMPTTFGGMDVVDTHCFFVRHALYATFQKKIQKCLTRAIDTTNQPEEHLDKQVHDWSAAAVHCPGIVVCRYGRTDSVGTHLSLAVCMFDVTYLHLHVIVDDNKSIISMTMDPTYPDYAASHFMQWLYYTAKHLDIRVILERYDFV